MFSSLACDTYVYRDNMEDGVQRSCQWEKQRNLYRCIDCVQYPYRQDELENVEGEKQREGDHAALA